MTPHRRALADEFLAIDADTKQQLTELANRLSPTRDRLGEMWSASYLRSVGHSPVAPHAEESCVTRELLDLFFRYVRCGDLDGYYQAIIAKGREYQAAELPYGHLMLAVHHFEQVALPILSNVYTDLADLERALAALDRLSDNAIALIATSYFETTVAELTALQQVTDTALSTLELDPLLQSLLTCMVDAVGGSAGAILLRDEASGGLRASSYFGLPSGERSDLSIKQEEGLGGRVVIAEEPVYVADAQSDPLVVDRNLRQAGVRAMVGVPLKLGTCVIGAVQVGRNSTRPFGARETALLELLAERAAAAIDHAQLYQRTSRLLSQTEALQRVTASVTAKMALPQVLEVVVDGVAEVFGASRVAIFLRDRKSGVLECPASRGLSNRFIGTVVDRFGDAADVQELLTTGYFYGADVPHDARLDRLRPEIDDERIRTILILPFGYGTDSPGSLCLFHDEARRYDDEERKLAQTFADQTSIAIANATLYRQIRERAAELDRANSELQILDRMKADFLAMISHELRTPLTAILGYTDLLLRGARGELGERPSGDLQTIRANGQRLLTLINDLIDFSSIEAGHTALATRTLLLGRLMQQALDTFAPIAEARSITLRMELPVGLPPVIADTTAVDKVLNQLLSNAIKFTPPGGTVVVSALEAAHHNSECQPGETASSRDVPNPGLKKGRGVVVTVTDNGIGIPQEQLTRIWDHFYQVDSSSARRFGGTGLGLAIVKRLVEIQGGRIWAESDGVPGRGSRFSFSLAIASDQNDRIVAP